MRWIDIFLPEPGTDSQFDHGCRQAAKIAAGLEIIQARDGLDAVTVTETMAEAGRILFQTLTASRPESLAPDPQRRGYSVMDLDDPDHDNLIGFHFVAQGDQVDLPWTWLHNGLEFMLSDHPLCVGTHISDPADMASPRGWMQRMVRSRFLVGRGGGMSLPAILSQLLPPEVPAPELLFVPGHGDRNVRRLIFREAETITTALQGGALGRSLGRLHVPDGAVTPTDLTEKSLGYQALHYAGPTREAAQYDASEGEYWMNRMLKESAQTPDYQVEELAGMEGEVLGVDPITCILEDISERYELQGGLSVPVGKLAAAGGAEPDTSSRSLGAGRRSWLLADGPVDPLQLGHRGGMPPLVFSNSYLSLPHLGSRCTAAGASTFIGLQAPVYSRPARRFVGEIYTAMAAGWCAGAAVWQAARICRRDLGRKHPVWLSYGVRGYGSLALAYL